MINVFSSIIVSFLKYEIMKMDKLYTQQCSDRTKFHNVAMIYTYPFYE